MEGIIDWGAIEMRQGRTVERNQVEVSQDDWTTRMNVAEQREIVAAHERGQTDVDADDDADGM